MISQKTIEEVKQRARLIDLVGEVVQLKRAGSGFVGLCPFHNEKTPSFNVKDSDEYYHCFGCGASGSVFNFVMQTRGLTFPEAVEELAGRYSISVIYEGGNKKALPADAKDLFWKANAFAFEFFRKNLKSAPPRVKEYLQERGLLDSAAAEEFGIGFCPADWRGLSDYLQSRKVPVDLLVKAGLSRKNNSGELYDYYRARLIIPIFTDAKHIAGFGGRVIPGLLPEEKDFTPPKYINSPETPVYQKSKILFGLKQATLAIREHKEVIVVEGYMDVISLWSAGVKNAVACCGTALTSEHVKRLSHLASRVTLIFDGDAAGQAAAAKSFPLFINSGLDVAAILLPGEHDPDTIARKYGSSLREELGNFERVPVLGCYIDNLILKYGGTEESLQNKQALGAAIKGRIAADVSSVLTAVINPIEKDELFKFAAFYLQIKLEQLQELARQARTKQDLPVKVFEEVPTERETAQICPVESLPRADRELLHIVMAEWDRLTEILSDSDIFEGIQTSTRLFIEGLSEVLRLSEDSRGSDTAKKEKVKGFLSGFGESWVTHWKKSYAMKDDTRVDFKTSLKQCKNTFKKRRLQSAVDRLDNLLVNANSDEEKLGFIQERLVLQKTLAGLG